MGTGKGLITQARHSTHAKNKQPNKHTQYTIHNTQYTIQYTIHKHTNKKTRPIKKRKGTWPPFFWNFHRSYTFTHTYIQAYKPHKTRLEYATRAFRVQSKKATTLKDLEGMQQTTQFSIVPTLRPPSKYPDMFTSPKRVHTHIQSSFFASYALLQIQSSSPIVFFAPSDPILRHSRLFRVPKSNRLLLLLPYSLGRN